MFNKTYAPDLIKGTGISLQSPISGIIINLLTSASNRLYPKCIGQNIAKGKKGLSIVALKIVGIYTHIFQRCCVILMSLVWETFLKS